MIITVLVRRSWSICFCFSLQLGKTFKGGIKGLRGVSDQLRESLWDVLGFLGGGGGAAVMG